MTPFPSGISLDVLSGELRWSSRAVRFACLKAIVVYPDAGPSIFVRCRKCSHCLIARSRAWAARSFYEIESHPRTWFVTLTFRRIPKDRKTTSRIITLWLKRTRKNSSQRFRYLQVFEHGSKHGRLHAHLLVHGASALSERDMRRSWKHGISHAVLARPKDALYVAKYATKTTIDYRLRASQHYGGHWPPVQAALTLVDPTTI